MPIDLSYKDGRKDSYIKEFSDAIPGRIPTGVREVTGENGTEYDEISSRDLINVLNNLTRELQRADQEIKSLSGQLEYIYKNGVDGYTTKIQTIRARHPKPTGGS